MRTTLTIDDDVLAAAKARAVMEHRSVGEVISHMARQSLMPKHDSGSRSAKTGLRLLPRQPGNRIMTSDHVRQIQEQLDSEEAQAARSFSTPTS